MGKATGTLGVLREWFGTVGIGAFFTVEQMSRQTGINKSTIASVLQRHGDKFLKREPAGARRGGAGKPAREYRLREEYVARRVSEEKTGAGVVKGAERRREKERRRVKYNPAFLTAEELVASFVVRHTELELIVQVVRENVTKSNQHVLVIGPRGIGKTMLALRVVQQIRDDEALGAKWYPLVFGEESYQVSTPGEFWLEGIFHLAHRTGDERWQRTYEDLRDERDEERLQERALGQLMDFADRQGKRLLLVVENFNMLLGEQISDDDAWKLRQIRGDR
ncbi:MAG: ATP-binding protein [Planctomycetota bacterium]|jgi:hypothetical protein